MQWFTYALLAPIIWAAINHIDKYVISRYAENKKPEALVIFSCLTSGLLALIIFCFAPSVFHIELYQALAGILAGILFISGYIPYMYALQEDEVSIVAPLWQMTALISYVLGIIFLHESLFLHQILAGLLIISGAILMTLDFKKLAWKGRVFKLMFLASLLLSLNTLIFKIIGLGSSFWTATFWEYLGALIFGIILISFKSCRADFKSFVKEGGRTIVTLNLLAESMNVIARLFFNFAALLGPIALVYVVNSTQPFFIFLYAIILLIFFPKIQSENFSRSALLLKLGSIIIMIAGAVLLVL